MEPPGWVKPLLALQRVAMWDAPGRKWLKAAWVINVHKVVTLFLIFGMMAWFDNFSDAAWVYLALHGVYGYCWLIKDLNFRDKSWERKLSPFGAVNAYLVLLGWYWLIPLTFFYTGSTPSGVELGLAVSSCMLGLTLMIAADAQKHFTLSLRKGLMTEGVFRYTRNPNYLGEVLIYVSFCILAGHWVAWAVLGYAFFGTFLPNMLAKDASLSRHPGWAEYRARSNLLIPFRALLPDRAPAPGPSEA